MCIIFTCKEKRPADDVLVRANDRNPHGIGIAWREKGMVKWEKGLEIEDLLKRLHTSPPAFPFVMHFRTATTGGDTKELCHPFVASPSASTALKGSAKEVLFHNGHWPGWEYKIKENLFRTGRRIPPGPWNDSRAFAWHVGTYGKEVLDWLELRGEQRICLFSASAIQLIGSWSEADGFLYSNPSFSHMGPINITPKVEFEKDQKKHLTKKERKALRAAGKSTDPPFSSKREELGPTQKLLEAAHNCSVGRLVEIPSDRRGGGSAVEPFGYKPPYKRIPSWSADEGLDSFDPSLIVEGHYSDEDEEEKKAIPDWPYSEAGHSDEELPIIAMKPDRFWSLGDIEEILEELRVFNWKEFGLTRPKQPLMSV